VLSRIRRLIIFHVGSIQRGEPPKFNQFVLSLNGIRMQNLAKSVHPFSSYAGHRHTDRQTNKDFKNITSLAEVSVHIACLQINVCISEVSFITSIGYTLSFSDISQAVIEYR